MPALQLDKSILSPMQRTSLWTPLPLTESRLRNLLSLLRKTRREIQKQIKKIIKPLKIKGKVAIKARRVVKIRAVEELLNSSKNKRRSKKSLLRAS